MNHLPNQKTKSEFNHCIGPASQHESCSWSIFGYPGSPGLDFGLVALVFCFSRLDGDPGLYAVGEKNENTNNIDTRGSTFLVWYESNAIHTRTTMHMHVTRGQWWQKGRVAREPYDVDTIVCCSGTFYSTQRWGIPHVDHIFVTSLITNRSCAQHFVGRLFSNVRVIGWDNERQRVFWSDPCMWIGLTEKQTNTQTNKK